MASIKFGSIITSIKGKVGGTVFQGGTVAPIMRNVPQPSTLILNCITLPSTIAGAGHLCWFAKTGGMVVYRAAHYLKQLTSPQIDAWIAAAPLFPYTNKMGDVVTPYWNNIYTKFANLRLAMGSDPLVLPPLPPTFPLLNEMYAYVLHATLSRLLTMSIYNSAGNVRGFQLQVFASTSFSKGSKSPRGGFKLLGIAPLFNNALRYTYTLTHLPVLDTSFSAYCDGQSFTANAFGDITGDMGGTGTINFTTGVFTLVFLTPPALDADVECHYQVGETLYTDTFLISDQALFSVDISAPYIQRFGQPLVGKQIAFKVRWVEAATGVPSMSLIFNTTVL